MSKLERLNSLLTTIKKTEGESEKINKQLSDITIDGKKIDEDITALEA